MQSQSNLQDISVLKCADCFFLSQVTTQGVCLKSEKCHYFSFCPKIKWSRRSGPKSWRRPRSTAALQVPIPTQPQDPAGRRAGCQNVPSWRLRQEIEPLGRICKRKPPRWQASPRVLIWVSSPLSVDLEFNHEGPPFFILHACPSHLCLHFNHPNSLPHCL